MPKPKKKGREGRGGGAQWIRQAQVQVHMRIFVIYLLHSFHSVFSSFQREHFGGSTEKTTGPYQFFSLPSLQPNTHKKSFPFHFLSKVFHLPYFTSKQTHSYTQSSWRNEKVGGQKRFWFPSFLFDWEWKSRKMKKVSLYKFIHIPLLK